MPAIALMKRLSCSVAAAALLLPAVLQAKTYPARPIHVIVPATPGGSSDVFARILTRAVQDAKGWQFIVDYKPGAATNIGNSYVAKSAPDGQTLLFNGVPLAVNHVLHRNMNYDPAKDLIPIIEVAGVPNVVTVHPSVKATTLKELVALTRADPDKYSYGSVGIGSSGHLSGAQLSMQVDAKLMHVAYQGNAQAATDHIGGLLQVGFVNLPAALPLVNTGRLKALAVTSAKRSPLLPDVPTVAEALNLPDYELTAWFGLLAPAGTPQEIIDAVQREAAEVLAKPKVREAIAAAGGDVVGGTSADFAARIQRDRERLSALLEAEAGKQGR